MFSIAFIAFCMLVSFFFFNSILNRPLFSAIIANESEHMEMHTSSVERLADLVHIFKESAIITLYHNCTAFVLMFPGDST